MSQGDQRGDIFLCDVHRYDCLETIEFSCRPINSHFISRPHFSVRQVPSAHIRPLQIFFVDFQ
jgi:hypothetical protein